MFIIVVSSESSLNICTVYSLYIKIMNVLKQANFMFMKCNACHLYFTTIENIGVVPDPCPGHSQTIHALFIHIFVYISISIYLYIYIE